MLKKTKMDRKTSEYQELDKPVYGCYMPYHPSSQQPSKKLTTTELPGLRLQDQSSPPQDQKIDEDKNMLDKGDSEDHDGISKKDSTPAQVEIENLVLETVMEQEQLEKLETKGEKASDGDERTFHTEYSENYGVLETDSAQAQAEFEPLDFETVMEQERQEKHGKKQGNALSRALSKAKEFWFKAGMKDSKQEKTAMDKTGEDEIGEKVKGGQAFVDVSFFDYLKEQGKQEKKHSKKNNPNEMHAIKEQILKAQRMVKIHPKEVEEIQDEIKKKYNYYKEGKIEVTNEMLEKGIGVNQKDKLSFNEVIETTIEIDNREINEMILAAKHGYWHLVWPMLDKKPYVVNCIPEQRAWSVLHQAIYHGILEVVRRLVEYYDADINICTKIDSAKIAPLGTDSLSFAYILGRKEIFDYLLKYQITLNAAVKGEDISYFRLHTNGTVYPFCNYPLLQLTLASYKSFVSSRLSSQPNQSQHLVKMLPGVNSFTAWKDAKQKICNTLYGIDRQRSDSLKKASNRAQFYREIIRLYTAESDVYKLLTPALIKQPNSPYKPLASDLALGPFVIMLGAILFNWDELKSFKGTTYRGVCGDVTNKYEVGQTFLFLHFISSSKRITEAERFRKPFGTLFIFENDNNTWGPRVIEKMSEFQTEGECLFPLGAEFKVISVNKIEREIHLKLMNPSV